MVSTECGSKDILKTVHGIYAECKKLGKHGPSSYEMRKWKNVVKMDSATDALTQDPAEYVGDYEDYLLTSNRYPSNKTLRAISLKITKAEIKAVASEAFTKQFMVFHTGRNSASSGIRKIMSPPKKSRRRTSSKKLFASC